VKGLKGLSSKEEKPHGYKYECKNLNCSVVGGGKHYTFQINQPIGGKLLAMGRESGGSASMWLKL
jgi:hypothetical protein